MKYKFILFSPSPWLLKSPGFGGSGAEAKFRDTLSGARRLVP